MKLLFSSVVFIAILISSASSIDEEASERQIVKLQAHTSSQWPLYDRIVKNMAAVKNSEDDESRDEIPNKQVSVSMVLDILMYAVSEKHCKDTGADATEGDQRYACLPQLLTSHALIRSGNNDTIDN